MTRTPVPRSVDELQALALQGERRDVEFKEAVEEKAAIRKVVRAVAAMANLREGGLVVLGVQDKTGVLRGLSTKDLAYWGDRDNVLSNVNVALEPAVELEVHRIGACVVLEVRPFSKVPIVVRVSKGEAHQPDALVEGALLYRSSVMTSSAPISRMEDWNELRETLLIRALAGAKRLEDERKRAEHRADEERVRELLRAGRDAFMPSALSDEPPRSSLLRSVAGNFRSFQIRSQQSEAKTNLKTIYVLFRAYFSETDHHPPSLQAAGFQPEPGGRYVYRAVEGEIIGAEQRGDRAELTAAGLQLLARYDASPHIDTRSFLVMAVTRFEPEGRIDVWMIDRFGDPRCLTP